MVWPNDGTGKHNWVPFWHMGIYLRPAWAPARAYVRGRTDFAAGEVIIGARAEGILLPGPARLLPARKQMKTIWTMKLFTGLKKIREFERLQLPFFKSLIDFDIVIEIGFHEEQEQPLTLKQLFLLNLTSRTTVRRKLARLIQQGIVIRLKHANDHRASVLSISPAGIKLLGNYGGTLTAISAMHFMHEAEALSAAAA